MSLLASHAYSQSRSFIAILVLGLVFLMAFLVWDARFGQKPFVPYLMILNHTEGAACLLGALDFFHYSVFSVLFTCNCRPVSLSLMLIVMPSLKNMKLGEYGGAQTEEESTPR
jgi:hypothetical protein